MAKIPVIESFEDKVWVSLGTTINVGNYNSVRADAGYASTVRPDETLEEAKARVLREALEYIQVASQLAVEEIQTK
jgi:hypothetical protein